MKENDFVIKEVEKNDGTKVFYVGKMYPKPPSFLQLLRIKKLELEFCAVGHNGHGYRSWLYSTPLSPFDTMGEANEFVKELVKKHHNSQVKNEVIHKL
jgi:hypothetical protein